MFQHNIKLNLLAIVLILFAHVFRVIFAGSKYCKVKTYKIISH